MAKLLPNRPRIAVGMGTCGAGNGAEGVYHAFAEAIGQRGRDVNWPPPAASASARRSRW
jgi:NADH-quinone oxidoreductase subunit F